MDGWAVFAARIIAALRLYDKENKSDYARALSDEHGIVVLAAVMRKVDRQSQWEPILKGPQHHD